jgi:DMSO reductase anchor subunit
VLALLGGSGAGAGVAGAVGVGAGEAGSAIGAASPGVPVNFPGPAHAATLDAALDLTALVGAILIYAMSRVYRLRTVPAWDTWRTPARFFLAAVVLGGLAAALVLTTLAGRPAPGIGPEAGVAWPTPALLTLVLAVAVVAAVVERVRFYDVLAKRGL